MSKINNVLLNVIIAIITISLCAILFDRLLPVFTGVDHRDSTATRSIRLREFYPNKNVKVKPPKDYLSYTDTLTFKKYNLVTNDDGYIVGPQDEKKLGENVDILFLGGSTTETLYVDEDIRFPYLVSKMLKFDNRNVVSLNGGLSGNNVMHSVLNLLAKGVDKKPKIAVLMHNVNDLSQLVRTGSYWTKSVSRSIVQEHKVTWFIILKTIKDLFIPNLYQEYKLLFGAINVVNRSNEWDNIEQNKYKIDSRLIENSFKSAIKTFIEICRAWGVSPILMTQMNRINTRDNIFTNIYNGGNNENPLTAEEYVKWHEKFNSYIRDIATSEKIVLVDLDRELSDQSKFIYDSVHLNNAGSIEAAKIISNVISKSYPIFKNVE